MISITIVLLLVALCFYIGVLYLNQTLLTIGYALGILLIASVAEVIYRIFTLTCHIDVPISMAEQGKPISVLVRIQNRGILPVGKVEVKVESKNVFQRKSKIRWLTLQDISVGEEKYPIQMVFKGAGCHDVLLTRVKIYSLFGLISIRHKCTDFSSVLIMPSVHSTNVQITEGVYNFLGDADVYDEFRPGHDSGETFEIRAYREKDKLQSIHWKLSAKMDSLMVKENSLPKACAVVLLLELGEPKKQKKKSDEACEGAFLELAASISFSLMDQKCPHFVAWYSTEKDDVRRIRVDDEESFYIFLNAYLREATWTKKQLRNEYRQKYKNEWYLHDIVINESLELYQNGKFLTKLNVKKIKDECEKMELLL